jgi:hypothetical protein
LTSGAGGRFDPSSRESAMARAAKPKPKQAPGPAVDKGAIDRDEVLELYRSMLLIRRFEERAGQLYGMGLIGGFCSRSSSRRTRSSPAIATTVTCWPPAWTPSR